MFLKTATTLKLILTASLLGVAINASAIEYSAPGDPNRIRVFDAETNELVCVSFDNLCDLPAGEYVVKIFNTTSNRADDILNIVLEDNGNGGGASTLADLNCMDGEVAISDGNRWSCGSPEVSVVDPVISDLLARIAALEAKVVYEIGDTGPGGGIVFKVNSSGTSGLEAAPADLPRTMSCNSFVDIPGVANLEFAEPLLDPNSGAHNTRQIRAVCGDDSAAGVAATYVWPEGQIDGYLPSIDELATLASQKDEVGGFEVSTYLSSSESNFGGMWVAFISRRGFNTDENIPKDSARRVRPIRAF
jgi:hypothetical protein